MAQLTLSAQVTQALRFLHEHVQYTVQYTVSQFSESTTGEMLCIGDDWCTMCKENQNTSAKTAPQDTATTKAAHNYGWSVGSGFVRIPSKLDGIKTPPATEAAPVAKISAAVGSSCPSLLPAGV